MSRRTRKPSEHLGTIAGGGLTPLLDTLFLLIFALLALSDTRRDSAREPAASEEVRIELPSVEAGDAAQAAPRASVTLRIDADGVLSIGASERRIASRGDLDAALEDELALAAQAHGDALKPADVTLAIAADRDAPHGVAVDLLQHLRLAGYGQVELIAVGDADAGAPFGGPR